MSERLKVKELIEILKGMPEDANVFISNLCAGYLKKNQIEYRDGDSGCPDAVHFISNVDRNNMLYLAYNSRSLKNRYLI